MYVCMNVIMYVCTYTYTHTQARAQKFWGAGAQKKKRAPIAEIITELFAAVPCPSSFFTLFFGILQIL